MHKVNINRPREQNFQQASILGPPRKLTDDAESLSFLGAKAVDSFQVCISLSLFLSLLSYPLPSQFGSEFRL